MSHLPVNNFSFFLGRGPRTHDWLSWPTKTRQHGGENVPAIFDFLSWDVANPRTTVPISTICFFNLSIFNQFTALRSSLIGELQSDSELIALLSYPFFCQVSCFVLHERYIPSQQFEKFFQTCVSFLPARQDGRNLKIGCSCFATALSHCALVAGSEFTLIRTDTAQGLNVC